MVLTAEAVTYENWLKAKHGPVGIRLEPYADQGIDTYHVVRFKESTKPVFGNTAERDWEIPSRPIGGFPGYITIEALPEKPAFPLRIRLVYSQVLKDDLLPPASNDTHALAWNQPMGLLDLTAPTRVVRYTIEHVLATPEDATGRVPLMLPLTGGGFPGFGGAEGLFSCRAEIVDAEGHILGRKLLLECFYAARGGFGRGEHAWVMEEAEADRLLRELAGINDPITVERFPEIVEPYQEIAALWVSSKAWENGDMKPAMARRLVLMGLWLYGRTETVEAIRGTIGLPGEGPVLLGGLDMPDTVTFQARRTSHRRYNQTPSLWDEHISHWQENPTFPLENRKGLFRPMKKRFAAYTLFVLLSFTIVAGIGLPLAFVFLKGSHRMRLWWGAPALAVLFAAGSWGIGLLVLDHDTRADVTEYRFAYDDWPEVYCHAVARFLNFRQQAHTWTMPAESMVWTFGGYSSANKTKSRTKIFDSNETGLILEGLERGTHYKTETGWFATHRVPVRVAPGNPAQLLALEPLQNVHVWHDSEWHVLGEMAEGMQLTVAAAGTTNRIVGLPSRLQGLFREERNNQIPDHLQAMMQADQMPAVDPFKDKAWIVLAVQEKEPGVTLDPPSKEQSGRIVWVVQLPIEEQVNRTEEEQETRAED